MNGRPNSTAASLGVIVHLPTRSEQLTNMPRIVEEGRKVVVRSLEIADVQDVEPAISDLVPYGQAGRLHQFLEDVCPGEPGRLAALSGCIEAVDAGLPAACSFRYPIETLYRERRLLGDAGLANEKNA